MFHFSLNKKKIEQFYIYFLILFCTYYLVTWSFFLCGWMGVCVCVCACTVTCSSGRLVVTTCTSSPQRRDHSLTDMESLQFLVLHRHTRPLAFGLTAHSQSVCYWPVTGAVSAPGFSFPHFWNEKTFLSVNKAAQRKQWK